MLASWKFLSTSSKARSSYSAGFLSRIDSPSAAAVRGILAMPATPAECSVAQSGASQEQRSVKEQNRAHAALASLLLDCSLHKRAG